MAQLIYWFSGTAGEWLALQAAKEKQKRDEDLKSIGFSVHPVRSLLELAASNAQ